MIFSTWNALTAQLSVCFLGWMWFEFAKKPGQWETFYMWMLTCGVGDYYPAPDFVDIYIAHDPLAQSLLRLLWVFVFLRGIGGRFFIYVKTGRDPGFAGELAMVLGLA